MWEKPLNRDKKTHMTVNTLIIPKQRYNGSQKNQSQSISIQVFLILNGHQQWPKISTNLNLTKKSSRIS